MNITDQGYLELPEKSNKHFLQELSNKYGISQFKI